MHRKNTRVTLASRIITFILVTFATVNGIFSTKLNAKAVNKNNDDDPSQYNHDHKSNRVTLIHNDLFSNAASQLEFRQTLNDHYQDYHHVINSIKSDVNNQIFDQTKPVNSVEASSAATNLFMHHVVKRSFTSINNYYDQPSDAAAASSVAQPKLYVKGTSPTIDKIAIQNRYPAEFQSLNDNYQNASAQVKADQSKASKANQYVAAYHSLKNRSNRNAFNWHVSSGMVNYQSYQDNVGRQYQNLASSAKYIYAVSNGINRANQLSKMIYRFNHNPLYRGVQNLQIKRDAKSLTAVNQTLASNNSDLNSANNDLAANQKTAHQLIINDHLMTMKNKSTQMQSVMNVSFINQVGKRCFVHNHGKRSNAARVFQMVINRIAKKFRVNDLNNDSALDQDRLMNQLNTNDVVIYSDQKGNVIDIVTGDQPAQINQPYDYAFPLYTLDRDDMINVINSDMISNHYPSFRAANTARQNQVKQHRFVILSRISALKQTNRTLTNKENELLAKWEWDALLTSRSPKSTKLSRFYSKYLTQLTSLNNQIYHGAFGINVYVFNPAKRSFQHVTTLGGNLGTRMKFSKSELNRLEQDINRIYGIRDSNQVNKTSAIFKSNDVVLPEPIFQFLKKHHYKLANGQSVARNVMLCSVKFKKGDGNLNLFMRLQHCNRLNDLNYLGDHSEFCELVPILHNYYPLGDQATTTALNSILPKQTNDRSALKSGLQSASVAVNSLVNDYQASLSNFVSCSGLNNELASAEYFASSYASDVKDDQNRVSLADVALANFYVDHSHQAPQINSPFRDRNATNTYWRNIPQYVHISKGLPIYFANHQIHRATSDMILEVTGVGINHNGQLLYKTGKGYVSADDPLIENAYNNSIAHDVIVSTQQKTPVYRDVNLTVPFKTVTANVHARGRIIAPSVGSEKTVFRTNNGNYLPADTQHIKVVKR